jgi:hypothetical protein
MATVYQAGRGGGTPQSQVYSAHFPPAIPWHTSHCPARDEYAKKRKQTLKNLPMPVGRPKIRI